MPSPPQRIAFCITDLDPGGAERALVRLATGLDREHWEPVVFCLGGPGRLVDELTTAGIPVTCFGVTKKWQVSVLRRLARELRRCRPALLQTFLHHANIAGRLAGRWAGVPRIVSGIRVAEHRSRFRLRVDRVTDRWVDRHVCVSRSVAEFSQNVGGLPAQKLVVIPNGVDLQRFADARAANLGAFGIPAGRRTFVAVGRLDPQKAPLRLLEAFVAVRDEFDDAHLLYVGEGPLRESLEAEIDCRNLGNRVHLAGWQEDVPGLLAASTGLVLAARWEGLPNVVLEAMAAGRPVIACDVEGLQELVRSGETGLLVPPEATAELGAAMRQVLSDGRLAAKLGRNAQHAVSECFTWEETIRAYASLYDRLLAVAD